MSQINPIAFAFIQNVQTQRDSAVEKERELRREQAVEKDIASREDAFEHQVESSQAVQPVQDEAEEKQPKRNPTPKHAHGDDDGDDEPHHLDLTA